VQSDHVSASAILQRLREWETPIVARVEEGRVLLDLRTIEPAQETIIVAAMKHISQ
jgi:seryl-tRNA(Sec) selenium transferase